MKMNDISKLMADPSVNSRLKPVLLDEYQRLMHEGLKTRMYKGEGFHSMAHRRAEVDYDAVDRVKYIAHTPYDTHKVMDLRKKEKIDSNVFSSALSVHDGCYKTTKDRDYADGVMTMYILRRYNDEK